MSQALKSLLTLLNLEKIEEGLPRGQSGDLGLRQVFGGQVMGQALYVARETISDERLVHSFRSYFLRPSDNEKPITRDVETLRDGNSFSACRVPAIQNGKPIFYMTVSFQAPGAGFEYQKIMPSAPAPDDLPSGTQIAQSLAHLLPPVLKDKFISDHSFEVHPMEFHNPLKGHVAGLHRQAWIRASGSVPDDLCAHQYLLGYASDLNFLPVALQPRGISFLESRIQVTTIDHFMWFHRPSNLNEWLLYSVESISASNVRGFVYDKSHAQDGMLVTSTIQEGVMHNYN